MRTNPESHQNYSAVISFKKKNPESILPKAQRPGDAGMDLYVSERVELPPGCVTHVPIGVILADVSGSTNFFLKVEGRSGLAKEGIFPVGGVVDKTYRGEIGAIMMNASTKTKVFNRGDRIAQLIAVVIMTEGTDLLVEESEEVSETVRGAEGFGSSGK